MDEIDAIATTPILAAPVSLVERRTKQVRGDDDEDDVGKTEPSVVAIPSMMMGGIDVEFTKEPKRKLTKKNGIRDQVIGLKLDPIICSANLKGY